MKYPSKRLLFLKSILALLLGLGISPAWWMNAALVLVALAAVLTVYRRSARALEECAADSGS